LIQIIGAGDGRSFEAWAGSAPAPIQKHCALKLACGIRRAKVIAGA